MSDGPRAIRLAAHALGLVALNFFLLAADRLLFVAWFARRAAWGVIPRRMFASVSMSRWKRISSESSRSIAGRRTSARARPRRSASQPGSSRPLMSSRG